MSKKINPLAMLGFLGLIGIVGVVTGKVVWYSWFAWFAWFQKLKKPTDERFFRNIGKSGLVCFVLTILGLSAVVILRGINVSNDIIFNVIGILFAVLIITFTVSFEYFERCGE